MPESLSIIRVETAELLRRVYADRAEGFRASVTPNEYVDLTLALDRHPKAQATKSVYVLAVDGEPLESYRASLQIHVRDIWFRPAPGEQTTCQAAYVSGIYTPAEHRLRGYARLLMRSLIVALREKRFESLKDVAIVCLSAEPGTERIYDDFTFYTPRNVGWKPTNPPRFDALGALPSVEPLYDHDLERAVEVAGQRMQIKLAASARGFAVIPMADQVRHCLTFFKNALSVKFPDQTVSPVVGARVGALDSPDVSILLFGFMAIRDVVVSLLLSATEDLATAALCKAMTLHAEQQGAGSVGGPIDVTEGLRKVFDFKAPTRHYSNAALSLDRPDSCEWIQRVRRASADVDVPRT